MGGQRVIIIGSGPAGTRCAEALVAAGLRPVVIDENGNNGGQVYRRQPRNFVRGYGKLYGSESDKAAALHADFDAIRDDIDFRPDTLAWAVSSDTLFAVENGRSIELPFDALILCTGASERVMPTPGWNYAGTYSLGGAQIALKSQACAIGRNVVFMGTGPLLYLIASQYIAAGATVAAVLDTSTIADGVAGMPGLLAQPSVLWRGMAMLRAIRAADVPIVRGVLPIRIKGTAESGVAGLEYRDRRGQDYELACDAVALGYHLRPESQLADLAGCTFSFDSKIRQWVADIDDNFRVTANVYMAGDGARVLGADAAEVSGRLAAQSLLTDLGHEVDRQKVRRLRRQYTRYRRFAKGLSRAFPWPVEHVRQLPDDTVVCRCEAITVGQLRDVASEKYADEINRAKAFSRVGMGRCQGRFCSIAAAEIVADAAKIPVRRVGRMRGQAPVKPLPIAIEQDNK